MKTILVLTDFSATAQVALQYAGMLSQKLPARLILLHAVPRHSPWLGSVDDELVREARKKQEKLKEKLITQGIPANMLSSEVINYFPLDMVVRDFAKAEKADLIVMGTKGVSAKGNAVLGSYTVGVMESSPVPVIAVPGDVPVTAIGQLRPGAGVHITQVAGSRTRSTNQQTNFTRYVQPIARSNRFV